MSNPAQECFKCAGREGTRREEKRNESKNGPKMREKMGNDTIGFAWPLVVSPLSYPLGSIGLPLALALASGPSWGL
jgi:hypothetical protein